MAKRIHPVEIEGKFKNDAEMVKIKQQYEGILDDMLRDKGYVPVTNIFPQWEISWNRDKDEYSFLMTMYGVYVGKRKARKVYLGWDGQLDKWIMI